MSDPILAERFNDGYSTDQIAYHLRLMAQGDLISHGGVVRWGMDRAEIIAAVGSENISISARQSWGSLASDLSIPEVKIGRYSFVVTFQMDESEHLAQVLIRHQAANNSKEVTGAFNAAMSQLTGRFGRAERNGTTNEFHWSFPTTTISIMAFNGELMPPFVAIRFLPTSKPDSRIAAF